MHTSVPYTAIEFHYFKSGASLVFCPETGLYEERDNEVVTIQSLGLRYTREPIVFEAWPDEDFFE